MLVHILIGLACFLVGSIPFGFLLGKLRGVDIRTQGSGNTGATNTARVLGKAAGLLTLLLDIGKGALGVYLGMLLDSQDKLLFAQVSAPAPHSAMVDPVWACAGGMLALFGHCFSPFLRFKGGKGVATGLGVFVLLSPLAAWFALSVFGMSMRISRYVSLSSILATLVIPLTIYFEPGPPKGMLLLTAILSTSLVILRHHGNIKRLLEGTEPKWAKKPSKKTSTNSPEPEAEVV